MYYILCEGELNCSEYVFVKSILEEFGSGVSYKQIALGGNKNIESTFNVVVLGANMGDTVILFFDNVLTINNTPVFSLLNNFASFANKHGVKFGYTNYYCFEELFLSYEGLFSLVSLPDKEKNQLKILQQDIIQGVDYFSDMLKLLPWKDLLGTQQFNSLVASNREHFSAALCSNLLSKAKGSFQLQKSRIGACWVQDCDKVNKSRLGNGIVCEKRCTYCCKNCTFREKLADLDARLVSKNSSSFSTIFD